MNDPNILYDYIWSKDELDPYRKMYDDWKGDLVPPEINRGNRHIWVIDDNYPDPDKIIQAYVSHLPLLAADEFLKSTRQGYSVDNKLSKYYEHQEFGEWFMDYEDGVDIHMFCVAEENA